MLWYAMAATEYSFGAEELSWAAELFRNDLL